MRNMSFPSSILDSGFWSIQKYASKRLFISFTIEHLRIASNFSASNEIEVPLPWVLPMPMPRPPLVVAIVPDQGYQYPSVKAKRESQPRQSTRNTFTPPFAMRFSPSSCSVFSLAFHFLYRFSYEISHASLLMACGGRRTTRWVGVGVGMDWAG